MKTAHAPVGRPQAQDLQGPGGWEGEAGFPVSCQPAPMAPREMTEAKTGLELHLTNPGYHSSDRKGERV